MIQEIIHLFNYVIQIHKYKLSFFFSQEERSLFDLCKLNRKMRVIKRQQYNMAHQQQALKSQASINLMKLHYFNVRGTCQPIRNLLYYLDTPFEQVLYERTPQNEVEVGFNIGLPFIEVDHLHIHQTIAIMSFLSLKFSQSLIGYTPQSNARIKEVLMKYSVQRKRINAHILQSLLSLSEASDKIGHIDNCLKKLSNQCKFIEYCLKNLGRGRNFIQDSITIVDFIFYEICFYISGFFGEYINKQSIFKFFVDFKEKFENLKFFKNHQKQIKQIYLFHAFSNETMNNLIEQKWKGDKYKILKRD